MKRYPPRFTNKPIHMEYEGLSEDRFRRVCPGCLRPLTWMYTHKLIRMDAPKQTNDLEDIAWVPELRAYLVPRYIENALAICPKDGCVDWWLILDTANKLIVGLATDHPTFWPKRLDAETGKMAHPEGGRLFRSPMRITRLLMPRLARGRACRFAGRWRMNQGNQLGPKTVGPGEQLRMF